MDICHIFVMILYLFNICIFSLAYEEYKLEGYKLCAKKPIKAIFDYINQGPEIELDTSAANITQTWNSTYFRKMRSNCSFKIKTKKPKGGIYIVITKLKFRKNPVTNSCIDYIEFSQPHSKVHNRTCERFGADETQTQLQLNNREKEVRITVSVDQKTEITEPLELNIIATAHFDCNDKENSFQCDPNIQNSCISKDFVNDGIKNCMPPCRDETDCSLETVSVEIVDASKVALSAITSLIFTTVAVGTCFWICWKYKDCMNVNRQQVQTNQQQQNQNVRNSGVSGSIQTINTEMQRPPSPKEDLPPSYESLFPDR